MSRLIRCIVWCGVAASASQIAVAQTPAALRVHTGGVWREWWRQSAAPRTWPHADSIFSKAVEWKPFEEGADLGEVQLSGRGEAIRLRLILVRLSPANFKLEVASSGAARAGSGSWNVDSAAAAVSVALNAGQFNDAGPWGWIVSRGVEVQPPGFGPLSVGIAIDSAGRVSWLGPNEIPNARSSGKVLEAFQSYPVLLDKGGRVPEPLRREGSGVDLRHRDSRLALGELRDGRLLIVLTRVDRLPRPLDATPFGLTVPEMAAVMGALGCRRAVLLDGGISGQLLVREKTGRLHAWRGWRSVPLGLTASPRR